MANSNDDGNNNLSMRGRELFNDGEQSEPSYVQMVKNFLARGMLQEAYNVLLSLAMRRDDDPILLSYFGYLTCVAAGRYRQGIETCDRAIHLFDRIWLRQSDSVDERLKAVLYLNLSKAYLASERRKEAFETLQKGLRYDTKNRALHAELEKMGIRKFTPLPFLDRSNPLNIIVGRLLRRSHRSAAH
jgi:tetratricopeptide (TPR) repeat protein